MVESVVECSSGYTKLQAIFLSKNVAIQGEFERPGAGSDFGSPMESRETRIQIPRKAALALRRHREYTLELERKHGHSPVRDDVTGRERAGYTDEHIRKLFLDRFPTLLRWARTDAGLSTRELARRAKIDPTYLSRVERSLSPPPTWTKIAAIAAQVPLSELAKIVNQLGGGWLRQSVLQSAIDLEQTISSLPSGAFEDSQWRSSMHARLERCLMLVEFKRWRGTSAEVKRQLAEYEDMLSHIGYRDLARSKVISEAKVGNRKIDLLLPSDAINREVSLGAASRSAAPGAKKRTRKKLPTGTQTVDR